MSQILSWSSLLALPPPLPAPLFCPLHTCPSSWTPVVVPAHVSFTLIIYSVPVSLFSPIWIPVITLSSLHLSCPFNLCSSVLLENGMYACPVPSWPKLPLLPLPSSLNLFFFSFSPFINLPSPLIYPLEPRSSLEHHPDRRSYVLLHRKPTSLAEFLIALLSKLIICSA